MWGSIAIYTLIGMAGMALQDSLGTFMVRAISTGRGWLAGAMDALGDIAKIGVLSIAGVELTHAFGWHGYIGIFFIAATGFAVTTIATHKAAEMVEDEDEAAEDDERDRRIANLEREINALKSRAN